MKAIDFESLAPGRHLVTLSVNGGAGKPTIEVPVDILVGRKPRPRFAVVGGVHGDEYDGIRAAQRLAASQSPELLDGTLVVIPVANPASFFGAQRRTPVDDIDLNRVFPGKPDGIVSEQLAHTLTEAVLRHMDLVFTMHGGGALSKLAVYLEFLDIDNETGRRSFEAAAASGFTNLVAFNPETKGYALPALGRMGVPVIEGEVGGRGELHTVNVDYYLERCADVMAHLGMIPKRVRGAVKPPYKVWGNADVPVTVTGMLQLEVSLEQAVVKGQRLASINDLRGVVVAEVIAPCDGVISAHRGHAWIEPGQMACRLFVPTTGGR